MNYKGLFLSRDFNSIIQKFGWDVYEATYKQLLKWPESEWFWLVIKDGLLSVKPHQ